MAEAMGLKMLNESFQIATMNDTEPSPSDVAGFEDSLKNGSVKILFYNSQVTDDTTARLLDLAKANKVPVIGVTRPSPPDKTVQTWFAGRNRGRASLPWRGILERTRLRQRHHRAWAAPDPLRRLLRHRARRSSSACWDRTAPAKPPCSALSSASCRCRPGRIGVLGAPPPAAATPPSAMCRNRAVPPPQFGVIGSELLLSAHRGGRWGFPMPSRADRAAVAGALERVGATELAKRPVTELSGGERQRLFIAQALVGQPKLLLLDEPLINLDPAHQRAIVELVRDISRERNIAVLFSAHEVNPLLRAVDRVLYLGNGQAAIGSVDQVVTEPVLSALYGTEVRVIRTGGRIFVIAEDGVLDGHEHHHEHGGDAHPHEDHP